VIVAIDSFNETIEIAFQKHPLELAKLKTYLVKLLAFLFIALLLIACVFCLYKKILFVKKNRHKLMVE